MNAQPNPTSAAPTPDTLERRVGLLSALAFNMMNMIGVGPFITLPLVVAAMGGSQAMLGWVLGAILALADGLVWAELGAAMPEAGGSYAFLREIYGRDGAGRLVSFLYIWQLGFSAPLSIASGCIGFAEYAVYLYPPLAQKVPHAFGLHYTSLLAAAICLAVVAMLYRNVDQVKRLGLILWAGVMLTIGAVILAGFTHFHPALLVPPPGAWHLTPAFWTGLGAATLISTYDYWGYYNVCFIGSEIRQPEKTIPRAVLLSVVVVAVLYLSMNISVLGVIPAHALKTTAAAEVIRIAFGPIAGGVMALFIMWTALSSVFALLLGYSRAPYAAALDGNYFRAFAHVHRKHKFPDVSLLALGAVATLCCLLPLAVAIAALVVIRIVLQYVLQQVGVMILRVRRPEMPRPFRMWLYPLPPLVALAGFFFILISRQNAARDFLYAVAVGITGAALYFLRARQRREWPFAR
uniref:APC family permease n=1 Tax=Acidobacterium capsulatum TaxID=33075 RepID=A0A7V5CUC7_9BACT